MSGPVEDNSCDPIALRGYFSEGLRHMGLSLDEGDVDRLLVYCRELMKWNRTINLVAAAPIRAIIDLHFLDALAMLPVLQSLCPSASLLDIGTGAGFPGLVVKAAFPEIKLTLLEPRQKRVSFLNHIIRTLSLKAVKVLPLHLEAGKAEHAALVGRHSVVTSRALADISGFLRLAASVCQPGGYALCMKGPRAAEEITSMQQDDNEQSPFRLDNTIPYTLPFSGQQRSIVIFQKHSGDRR